VSAVPLWFVLALLCALSWSAADVLSKHVLRGHSPGTVMWVRWGYAVPLLALAFSVEPFPRVEAGFGVILFLAIPLEIAAGLLYLHALKLSPMSLTVPFLAWTPVFTALASLVVLGEIPGPAGAAGIALVASGSFLLTWSGEAGPSGFLAIVRRERGIPLMVAVAMIYSVTSALGKLGVRFSSPAFFGFTYALSVTAACTVLLAATGGKRSLGALRPNRWFVGVGVAAALMIIFHFAAIELTQVAYMISVKRSSLLFSVLLGRVFFGERETGRRFLGAAVMSAGMFLLLTQG